MPISSLTPALTIRRQSDGFFWTNTSFTSAFTQVTMSAVDATNQGGYYSYMFDTTGLADDTYSIMASGTGAANSPQLGELKVGGFIDNLDGSIRANSPVAGGNVINIKGVFTKEEKDKLIELIVKSFQDVLLSMDGASLKLSNLMNSLKLIKTGNEEEFLTLKTRLSSIRSDLSLALNESTRQIKNDLGRIIENDQTVGSKNEIIQAVANLKEQLLEKIFGRISEEIRLVNEGIREQVQTERGKIEADVKADLISKLTEKEVKPEGLELKEAAEKDKETSDKETLDVYHQMTHAS